MLGQLVLPFPVVPPFMPPTPQTDFGAPTSGMFGRRYRRNLSTRAVTPSPSCHLGWQQIVGNLALSEREHEANAARFPGGQPKWQGDLPELARPDVGDAPKHLGRLVRLPRWRTGRHWPPAPMSS
jgi:hypothetical protein